MEGYINEKAVQYRKFLKEKRATVIGAGISNIPLVDFLLEAGASVTVRDKKERAALSESLDIASLEERGVEFVLGEGYLRGIDADIVYKTPGVRYDNPEILEAYDNGAYITGEMEAFLSICPAKVVAVTGSNGKTTTSTLCAKLLEASGHRVFLGGNIGKPLLSQIDEMTPDDFAVLELSSFQLHTINRFENAGLPFSHITFPNVAIITNVSPNHLDWHISMEEYAEAKRAVFEFMPEGARFVTNGDCPITADFARYAGGRNIEVLTFSGGGEGDIFLRDGEIVRRNGTKEAAVIDTDRILIPGRHNIENYMAAYLALENFLTPEALISVAQSFAGVPFRFELCHEKDGVKFYDSSIDSSPSRTVATLEAMPEEMRGKIHIILGGYDKKIPFDILGVPVCEKVKGAYICGDTAKKIEEAIRNAPNFDGDKVKITVCPDFDSAVLDAAAEAKPGECVLLSPACASFDSFKNFEERGKRFKALVKGI